MVALLNYFHIVIIAIAAFLMYRNRNDLKKTLTILVVGTVLMFGWLNVATHYAPKGTAPRLAAPPMEVIPEEVVIRDIQLKPRYTVAEREERHKELFDWREQVNQNKTTETE